MRTDEQVQNDAEHLRTFCERRLEPPYIAEDIESLRFMFLVNLILERTHDTDRSA